MKHPLKIVRFGLSVVFLSTGLAAFFAPQEYRELLGASSVVHWFPLSISAWVMLIGINDLLLSVLILANKYQKFVLVWTMVWLVLIMTTQDVFGILEHVGYFAMALALWVDDRNKNS